MIESWVLIIILMGVHDTHPTSVEFMSKEACITAANYINKSRIGRANDNGGNLRKQDIVFCTKKG